MELKLKSSKLKFKLNPKVLFQNLFDLNIGTLLTDTIDISLNIESKAYSLLYNTNLRTNVELSKLLNQEAIDLSENLTQIFQQVELEWKIFFEQEITLKKDFFENVLQHNQEYLRKSFGLFKSYLKALNIIMPSDFQFTYYRTFRENLLTEYNENKDKYVDLTKYFDNPFLIANKKIDGLLQHYQEVAHYFINPLQSDIEDTKETLNDLYIEPYFKVYRTNHIECKDNKADFAYIEKKLTLHDFINNYYLSDITHSKLRSSYNMLFILGQPGQGKTSSCYKMIYDVLTKSNGLPDTPLFFLKIRDLHARDFIDDTFNTINTVLHQEINFSDDQCLLILDGLDEAYMSGGITDNDLKVLYERLNKTCKLNKKLKIVLTSRFHYLKINDPSLEGSLVVMLDVLSNEQIKMYAENFKRFHPDNLLSQKIDEILEIKEFEHIRELLEQPVIMYFIALANINISKDDSKVIIYDKIFDSLAKRSWDKTGQLNYINPDLKNNYKKYSKLLRKYIRGIAFEIYQSPNLHITIKKLSELEATKDFVDRCFDRDFFETENLKEISKYLLISFYFQQSNRQQEEDTAIEFFHNSLWEFLTAEYMWIEYKRLVENKDEDGEYKTLRAEEYFNVLSRLVGNKELKDEIVANLDNIIKLEDSKVREELGNISSPVFYKLIEKDMMLTYDYKNEKLIASEKTHNIFILAWTFFYNCMITNPKQIIQTNEKLNYFLFNPLQISVLRNKKIERVYFTEHTYSNIFFHDTAMKNCTLGIHFSDTSFFRSKFYDCILHNVEYGSLFSTNIFENTFFKSGEFYINTNAHDNIFNRCKFERVSIPTKSFWNQFIKNNKVDEFTLSHHKIVKRREKNHDETFSTNYYIEYFEPM